MSDKYYCQYKDGATITIFAPYDCNNNCPFCVNKKEYKENPTFDLDKVLESLEKLHNITPRCDIVITGGEPFADVKKLKNILIKIWQLNKNSLRPHKVFINTTLPLINGSYYPVLDVIREFKNTITGLNVSRHVKNYVDNGADEIFEFLNDITSVRINTVLANINEAKDYKTKIYDKYKDFPAVKGFQIRDDYTKVIKSNLYVPSNEMIWFLYIHKLIESRSMSEAKRFYNENVIYSNDFRWNVKINDKISYHRTLPYSCIEGSGQYEEWCKEINDIIINPRGEILDDWNEYGKLLDLMAYKNRTYRSYGNLMERLW